MTSYATPVVDRGHVERTWTTIAAELDGAPAPDLIGVRRLERAASFAFRKDALVWLLMQEREGFTELDGPTPLATFYHGPSDSPSNAWSARASRELEESPR